MGSQYLSLYMKSAFWFGVGIASKTPPLRLDSEQALSLTRQVRASVMCRVPLACQVGDQAEQVRADDDGGNLQGVAPWVFEGYYRENGEHYEQQRRQQACEGGKAEPEGWAKAEGFLGKDWNGEEG